VRNKSGVVIEEVAPSSPAAQAGIQKGDILVSINGNKLSDIIDYMFYKPETESDIVISRKGKRHSIKLILDESEDPGIKLKQFRIKTCRNKCIFCFVSQLPRGLRKTLYIKDEDYRMSFLYGNYITMTNLTQEDKKRIARQRLSPLYISVHSTNNALRCKMLGNPKAQDILKELRFLKDNKIKMHTQIVLCPGWNDGKELEKTIRDLYSFYPYLSSIAVVPVGLTAHRKTKLKAVEKEDAENALQIISAFQKRFKKKHGDPIVYGADELYIKAGQPFPPIKDYGDLPQIENGVGMVALFMSKAKKIKLPSKPPSKKYLTITGVSFYPYLKRFLDRLEKNGISITPVAVENSFFGRSVTVTGLLTGRDVIKSLSTKAEGYDLLLLPDCMLRAEKDVFLDDVSVRDLESTIGIKTKIVESTPQGLLRGIEI
jgi:putative radical SAM enzyme (TIGR03279 family)